MPSVSRLGLCVPTTFLAALMLPLAAAAQQVLPTITAVAKADSLHQSAEIMARTSHRWRDAARLHRESATLRAPDDSLGYRCYTSAANLSFAANDLANAQSDKIAAAAQALARGDVEAAAQAYADAAWVANERKNPEQVWSLGRQAEILASSPLLSTMQRSRILERFTHGEHDMAVRPAR
jgi:hypothetical protein